ncbi:prolyl oligopeptidase family serine peptidase [Nonomuraea sp. NPDC000554]|uniref:alpha/beta hydrolase family protein n=1 Tax=Nonomuraea sp. NPDC000554 TaxID=3154259 RepID=UPI00331D7852
MANYRQATVTHYENVRVVTSLAGQGSPIAWAGDRLVVLVPGEPADDEDPASFAAPAIYEASGPGEVTFSPGLRELERLAAARVATFDPGTERLTPVSPPLLVRQLSPAPGGNHLIVEAGAGEGPGGLPRRLGCMEITGRARMRPLPEGTRWAVGRDATAWREDDEVRVIDLTGERWSIPVRPGCPWWVVWHGDEPAVLSSHETELRMVTASGGCRETSLPRRTRIPAGARGQVSNGRFLIGCLGADGELGSLAVDLGPFRARVKWARDDVAPSAKSHFPATPVAGPIVDIPTGFGNARLTIHSKNSPEKVTLLWVRAGLIGDAELGQGPPPISSGFREATLDLLLDWPSDATVAMLHDQITSAVSAAVDRCQSTLIVSGHSFGATLALYALAHVPEIAGAIAHSGCYNRTHTLTGFHFEKRSYWDAPDLYQAFSALHFADRLKGPVLIAHGLADVNPSTPPQEAIELYRAIVAAGGHSHLILLPHEGHSFRFRETHEALAHAHSDWLRKAGF